MNFSSPSPSDVRRSERPLPLAGLILDMDGTLFDSERVHVRAWRRVLEAVGVRRSPEWFQDWIGKPDRELPEAVLAENALPIGAEQLLARKAEVYREFVRGGLEPFPGLEKLLRALGAAGLPLAVCTSSRREDMRISLIFSGLGDVFPVRVSLDDVSAAKPDPAPYRLAAERLGLDPRACLAIEDSPSGIGSARAAGCLTYGVVSTHPFASLAQADRVFPSTVDALDYALGEGILVPPAAVPMPVALRA